MAGTFFVLLALAPAIGAVHFYRGPGGGCTPASGHIIDPPAVAPSSHVVLMLHNAFVDATPGGGVGPVTIINAGESVTWTWNSEHCHSVRGVGGAFYSGFHYPTATPTTPAVLPGFFHYPVPTLSATLDYTHTFNTPGQFLYDCEHHMAIGMVGVVIVL